MPTPTGVGIPPVCLDRIAQEVAVGDEPEIAAERIKDVQQ